MCLWTLLNHKVQHDIIGRLPWQCSTTSKVHQQQQQLKKKMRRKIACKLSQWNMKSMRYNGCTINFSIEYHYQCQCKKSKRFYSIFCHTHTHTPFKCWRFSIECSQFSLTNKSVEAFSISSYTHTLPCSFIHSLQAYIEQCWYIKRHYCIQTGFK